MKLFCPDTGAALRADTPHSLVGPNGRWPVIDGIPFLRRGRAPLVVSMLDLLDAGSPTDALALALADRDDHAKGPPPDPAACARVARGAVATLRDAMATLGYGLSGDYFAHRWSAPTYLSALALLSDGWREGHALVEVGCGIGQILRAAEMMGDICIGVDVVFSKLWLARRFVVGAETALVCTEAETLPIACDAPACVLCHDALYFMPDKAAVLSQMRRIAGKEGAVLIGHAHNSAVDQRGVGGTPLTAAEWSALMPDACAFDDAALTKAWLKEARADARDPETLNQAEALAFIEGRRNETHRPLGFPESGRALRTNPIFVESAGRLTPRWPTPSLAREYESADYLVPRPVPDAQTVALALTGGTSPEIARLVRQRVLIDLPEAW